MAKNDEFVRYTVRIPADLYRRVQRAAGVKSVNAEIVEALEEKYPAPTFDQIVTDIDRHMEGLTTNEERRAFIAKLFETLDDATIDVLLEGFNRRGLKPSS